MAALETASPSSTTATGLPLNGTAVNTSTCWKASRLIANPPPNFSYERKLSERSREKQLQITECTTITVCPAPASRVTMTAVKTAMGRAGRRSRSGRAFRYEETARFITDLVDSGTLIPGARVPSLREITRQRRVSLSTALQAYRALEDRGVLQARPQSGFYV